MKFKLGLTGSIGMGKSTTANIFAELGCAVWDADAAVHRLYGEKGAAVAPIAAKFPQAIKGGSVSRDRLRVLISDNPAVLVELETIVHPLVQQDREAFISNNPDKIGVFDIPLLFETNGDKAMDAVACVSISAELQRDRVMARGTMSAETLDQILSRQMPNSEKCARSTYVIETDTLEHARTQVEAIVAGIERQISDA
ncbi:dephospho-CoA kinase [uncultured Pelagimonas sp.]|uniref:dephospho-CoA kinase n=1 Tax=uncultured Pelagimonas sp. TaxID=1618102 RepID=UPI00261F4B45|nr:dephospho-CoA kinase [uncultured Pelagimonas sp.]